MVNGVVAYGIHKNWANTQFFSSDERDSYLSIVETFGNSVAAQIWVKTPVHISVLERVLEEVRNE